MMIRKKNFPPVSYTHLDVYKRQAQRRVDDVRSVVAGQFSGIGDILSDLSDEFKSAMKCDTEAAERVILPSEPVTLCVLHLRLFIPVIIQSDLTDRNGL